MTEGLNRQLLRLTMLLQLQDRARRAGTVEELGFVLVNETHSFLPYQHCALWEPGGRRGTVSAVSGVAVPDRNAPYPLWLQRLCAGKARQDSAREIHAFGARDLPDSQAEGWKEWFPTHALWLPLLDRRGRLSAALVMARAAPWSDYDRHLFTYLAGSYAQAWELRRFGRRRSGSAGRPLRRGLAAVVLFSAIAAGGALPVRQSTLASAEVVAGRPALVRAPFDGVVDEVHVEPNQAVAAGTPLFSLDQTRLLNRLEVAGKAREVAEAEYRQTAQQAVLDARARAQLATLKGRLDEAAADLAYVQSLFGRLHVVAPREGLAIFDAKSDWVGKPVSIGEKVMTVAEPSDVVLEMHLPVKDAIALQPGDEVLLFLNFSPDRPIAAVLESQSYKASPSPEGTLAYRLKGQFERYDPSLRIGLKGTAKLYGREAPLAFHVLRRPIGAVRSWLGL